MKGKNLCDYCSKREKCDTRKGSLPSIIVIDCKQYEKAKVGDVRD